MEEDIKFYLENCEDFFKNVEMVSIEENELFYRVEFTHGLQGEVRRSQTRNIDKSEI